MVLRGPYPSHCIPQFCHAFLKFETSEIPASNLFFVVIIIIGSTALGGPWPPEAHVASYLYPGQPPSQFLQPIFLASSSTPSIHLDFGRTRPRWPPGFVHIFFGKSLSSMRTTCPVHLTLLNFTTLTILVQCQLYLFRHFPLSRIGPYIVRRIFLSKILSLLSFFVSSDI